MTIRHKHSLIRQKIKRWGGTFRIQKTRKRTFLKFKDEESHKRKDPQEEKHLFDSNFSSNVVN